MTTVVNRYFAFFQIKSCIFSCIFPDFDGFFLQKAKVSPTFLPKTRNGGSKFWLLLRHAFTRTSPEGRSFSFAKACAEKISLVGTGVLDGPKTKKTKEIALVGVDLPDDPKTKTGERRGRTLGYAFANPSLRSLRGRRPLQKRGNSGRGVLAAARSRSRENNAPCCFLTRSRRFATPPLR